MEAPDATEETGAPIAGPSEPPTDAAPEAKPDHSTPTEPVLSKNQRKKLAKKAAWEASKPARKAAEKAKRKAKTEEYRRKRDAGLLDDDDRGPPKKKHKVRQGEPFKSTVIVDCSFDELMTDREIISMQSQLAHVYSVNRNASVPFDSVLFSSLSGKLKERFDKAYPGGDYDRWPRVSLDERSWNDLSSGDEPSLARESLVYLTADSPDVLEELEEGTRYIIGGLVDRNRHKNICFDRAKAAGIRHAQLPFGSYMSELKTRKVLTVNQVFHILSLWVRDRDWRKALEEVVPGRKMHDAVVVEGDEGEGKGEEGEATSDVDA